MTAHGAGTRALRVLRTGPLTTVQDLGRPGRGALGIGRSGAADRAAHRLANALVGNPPDAATLEVTLGGLVVEAEGALDVAVAGARCPGAPHLTPVHLPEGARLDLGVPPAGLRTYVAVRGGVDVTPVLGSRATDLLSGIGPPVVAAGDRLPVGARRGPFPGVDVAPVAEPAAGEVTVVVLPGPRPEVLDPAGWDVLTGSAWTVGADSNRIGVRLEGPALALARRTGAEPPSEGMLRGAVQVPPSGHPVVFLADHPVTGGYPVPGYVRDADVDRCAQVRPGQRLRFRYATGRSG